MTLFSATLGPLPRRWQFLKRGIFFLDRMLVPRYGSMQRVYNAMKHGQDGFCGDIHISYLINHVVHCSVDVASLGCPKSRPIWH